MKSMGPRLAAAAPFLVMAGSCGSSSGGTVATGVGIRTNQCLLGNTASQPVGAHGAPTFGKDFNSNKWTLGWQPPYQGESHIYAKDVLQNHPNAKIGVLYQNDDYGQDYLKGLIDGLGDKASTMIVDKESYDVTSASPASQL